MQYREVPFIFPEEATDRDKVMIVLQSPYRFVRWCRTQVGMAPNAIRRLDDCCIVEQYLLDVASVECAVADDCIMPAAPRERGITTPTWVQRVIRFTDVEAPLSTYNDVANMLMLALGKNELA